MSTLPSDILIRPFRPGDEPLVEHFFGQMEGESRGFFNRNGGNFNNAMRFFNGTAAEDTVYFLAEHKGEMIGYVFLWDLNRGVPWLGIAVHEGFKGKGLGRLLMQHVIDLARERDKGGVLLTTHVANLRGQGLYERMGFERVGVHTSGEILYLLRF